MARRPSKPAIGLLDTAEGKRIASPESSGKWRRWGPYLSERQWGTVREDYSPHGNAWEYVPHDHARSRAYRWGEDGIAGFGDDELRWCLSLALWNERDPILKERLFGLTNSEGNHGEDVKELYYYGDGVPSHAYMRMLYKYPQQAFPYDQLVQENRRRGASDPEFELVDTGVFDGRQYFDVTVEYAKDAPDDILMRIEIVNRGPDTARLHVLPQLWARNSGHGRRSAGVRSCRWRTAEESRRFIRNSQPDRCTSRAAPNCCSATTKPTYDGCSASINKARSRTVSTISS